MYEDLNRKLPNGQDVHLASSRMEDITKGVEEASLHDQPRRSLSTFERLPGEIRNNIYKCLFRPESNLELRKLNRHIFYQLLLDLSLLRCNKQIYRECWSYIYGTLGPAVLVRGFPINLDILDLMAQQGIRPFFVTNKSESLPMPSGMVATVEFEVFTYSPRNYGPFPGDREDVPFVLWGSWHLGWFVQFLQAYCEFFLCLR